MTKENFEFEEWMDFLKEYARSQHGAANFPEDWKEDFDNGLTPEEAWHREWD